jgi:hypothetical protein
LISLYLQKYHSRKVLSIGMIFEIGPGADEELPAIPKISVLWGRLRPSKQEQPDNDGRI